MKTPKEIFEYNTKNAGQQLLNLDNVYCNNFDLTTKNMILDDMEAIGRMLLEQYEKHKDKFE